MKQWYLVYTKARKEMVAEENLLRQGFTTYLPRLIVCKRRRGGWIELQEPMFPRYLFIQLQFGSDNVHSIRSTLGVSGLVRFSSEPAVIPEQVVESIKGNEAFRTAPSNHDASSFKSGDNVLISDGPLAGLSAIYLAESGRDRVNILLSILGTGNAVSIERDSLRLASI
jgi:transcriptional antiterminator RfaH